MKTIGDLITITNTVLFDDICELNMTEDKVKVDRHKLAEMLQDDGGERVQQFFERIMTETGTEITWPQQLKTGGKSKRDAYVKIYGSPTGIADAKAKILQVLNIESKNLILKLDVSYDHHSHMIGKDGHNIQQIMNTTGCHIHFPDSNRTNMVEKSNQVSISGNPDKAQEARRLVRASMPIVVKFEIPVANRPPQDTSGVIQQFQQIYGIVVRFYYTCNGTTVVEVRGPNKDVDRFSQAITALKSNLVGYNDVKLFLTMQISVQHHAYVRGPGNCNIDLIKQETNAEIKFPQPSIDGANESHKMAVEISGSFYSIYRAWERLKGFLPFVMTFDLKDGLESQTGSANINRLLEGRSAGITVYTRQKSKQNQNKVVYLKCPERQAETLFYLRKLLLKEEVFDHENSYVHFSPYNYLPPTNYMPVLADPKLPPSPVAPVIHRLIDSCEPRILPEIDLSNRMPFISDEGSTCASTVSSPSLSPRNDSLEKAYSLLMAEDSQPKELGFQNYCQSSEDSQKKIDENIPAVSINHRSLKYSSLPTEHDLFYSNDRNGYNEVPHVSSSSRMHTTKAIWNERRCCSHYEDYQWKKQLATKAMKSPVGSEMRVPTDAWFGYGFSKSMPPSVIKTKLLESSPWARAQSPINTENIENAVKDVGCLVRDPCLRLGRYSLAGNSFLSSSNCLDATSLRPSVYNMSELGDVPTVLMKMGLEEYTKNFTQQEIDMDTFLTMSEDDLKEVGIQCCHRQRILHKISELKELERKTRRARFEAAPGAERSLCVRLARQRSHIHQMSQQKS